MESFPVQILASDHPFYRGECVCLSVPTQDGMYGILAHHSNLIAAIVPGILQYRIGEQAPQEAAVSNGLLKVEDGEVLILVDTIERPEDIDRNRALAAKRRAEERLRQKQSQQEYYQTQAALSRALARLKAKSGK